MTDWSQVLAIPLPSALTIGGAVVSVVAAIGSIALSLSKDKSLEKTKSRLQRELEAEKAELQKEIEGVKAQIATGRAEEDARRAYEYEARKRLYSQLEPLLFQLFEACESAFHGVASLVRTQKMGELPNWLAINSHKYYIRSIIYRLFLPIAILRLIQRSATFVDLTLDESIRLRYALLKEAYLLWTDPHRVAQLDPSLDYKPSENNWQQLRQQTPAIYWRQGLVIGHLDRLADSFAVGEGAARRIMNFGEWEAEIDKAGPAQQAYEIVEDIFVEFDFDNRPVLARILISYACLMHVILSVYGKKGGLGNPSDLVNSFVQSDDKAALVRWHDSSSADILCLVRDYVLRRIKQAEDGDYVKF